MVKWKRGDNNNNDNKTNTGFRDDDSSSKKTDEIGPFFSQVGGLLPKKIGFC